MNPNSILGRYLSKQIILNFLGVLLMVLGVVFIFELIEMLRRAAGEDVGFLFVIQMAVTKLPQTIDMVFPFVMMIAAMITFWRLSKSNEFVIIRAAGVSIWGFLFPVLVTTFLIGIVNITVINPVSSKMYELYETMERPLDQRSSQQRHGSGHPGAQPSSGKQQPAPAGSHDYGNGPQCPAYPPG